MTRSVLLKLFEGELRWDMAIREHKRKKRMMGVHVAYSEEASPRIICPATNKEEQKAWVICWPGARL